MGYLGTKPQIATSLANNIVTADAIVSGAVTDAKIAAMAASKLTGVLPDANAPSGSVIQVVQTVKSDTFSSSSQSYTDITGLSVSITPISSSSNILVLASVNSSHSVSGWNAFFRLMRNSTPISIGNSAGSRTLSSFQHYLANTQDVRSLNSMFLDSPSTTTLLTYKIQCASQQGSGGNVTINMTGADGDSASQGRSVSTITVMEIAA